MTATERLRLMLDELGVKYYANDSERCFDEDMTTTWSYESYGDELTVTAIERIDGEGNPVTDADGNSHLVMDFHNTFTAEQAIAATLGRPTFNANLEQALSFMRIWISEDAHLGESAISRELEKAEGLRKLDAIESAIAATLGGQTAKLTAEQVREAIEHNFGKVAVIDDGGEKVEWREDWTCHIGFNS